jgi:hypothetical protein
MFRSSTSMKKNSACSCAGEWRGLQVAIKTVVFQSDLLDAPISRVASETVIATNLIHPNIVATYSHDISAVGGGAEGEPELGIYKFYPIQVRSQRNIVSWIFLSLICSESAC